MAKAKKLKTSFRCTECGHESARWMGRCSGCGEWNTMEEQQTVKATAGQVRAASRSRSKAKRLADIDTDQARRIPTGIAELDRALGGGAVAGGVALLGGDPGIGKSTLLMQALAAIAKQGKRAVYVTGEESAAQVALRGRRLAKSGALPGVEDVIVLATTELDEATEALRMEPPEIAVIDSIQTLRATELTSAPGTVSQLREVASRLIELAKAKGIALFLIGHVTKDGAIAGPKVLEHLVDTVLSFEGDRSHAFRMVRATKNRFGPAHEVGVFEMVEQGLREVPDPSALFLAERPDQAAGSVVAATAEGSRPLLVEVQALVAPAAYGAARRVVSGLDGNRLAILLAVLERKAEIHVLDRDVFASVAGGARIDERALDLAIAIAVVSSLYDRPIGQDVVAFGEVGLAGEIRAVPRIGARLMEARKLGFKNVVMPAGQMDRLTKQEKKGLTLIPVKTLPRALSTLFE